MGDTGARDLRNALRQALEAAKTAGVTPMIRLTLLVVQLGREMSEAGKADDLDKLVANIQAAVEHVALATHDDRETLERFADRSFDLDLTGVPDQPERRAGRRRSH